MSHAQFNSDLMDFIEASPTPFHAVRSMVNILRDNGFVELKESEQWSLLPGQNYYVTRNGSSIVAFRYGTNDTVKTGIRMVGAHTDSPCLKVKPAPEVTQKGYLQLGVEVYGGALFSPWFDRDLSLAGRVSYVTKYQQLGDALIDFEQPIAVIPSLAIHLDRGVNEERRINAQKELLPIVLQLKKAETRDFREVTTSSPRCWFAMIMKRWEVCPRPAHRARS
jgi:aspartyl aminopeptidase